MRGRIPFNPYPYQAEFLQHYLEPRRIVLKARQIGFSQIFALEALYVSIFTADSTVLLVSRSQDLAVNLLRYCYQTFNNLRGANPELVKANESEMGFSNGSRIKSIPANRSTGRGFAANLVYLDEFAYADYADDIYQSVSPTVSQGGRLVVGSTPNGQGNLFNRLYVGDESFYRIRASWQDCPAYYTPDEKAAGIEPEQCEWYKRERPNYPDSAWAAEYDCDFVASGGRVFRNVRANATLQPSTPSAHVGHRIVGGLDWANERDYTVAKLLCADCKQEVHSIRFNQLDWKIQRQNVIDVCEAWHVSALLPERNSIGSPNIEELQRDGLPIVRGDDDKAGFYTSPASKPTLIQSLRLAFEQSALKIINDAVTIGELEAYSENRSVITGNPQYGAPAGMHDDTVIALALAWRLAVSGNAAVETMEHDEYSIGQGQPF